MALTVKIDSKHPQSFQDIDPDEKGGYKGKDDPRAATDLSEAIQELQTLQERLFAEKRQALLVIFQALDAAGKDGALRKVAGPLDSRGVHVHSFRAPAGEETEHDYLWRVHARCPRRGDIMFFNRSHYEDVLVPGVMGWITPREIERRYTQINHFEQMLSDCGTRIVKFYLHISKAEQQQRLQERLDDPSKNWKFDPKDLETRKRWEGYMKAYAGVFTHTSSEIAPWYIVPANRKWVRDLAVATTLVSVLKEMDPQYPKPGYDPRSIVLE